MKTILQQIVEKSRRDLVETKQRTPLSTLEKQIAATGTSTRNFAAAFDNSKINIIAELKKSSPSKGLIRESFHPVPLAQSLESAGASTLSVLTEPHFFNGSLTNLRTVSAAVKIPVLRKDFIYDPYQIYEARANGADAILLIAALLDDRQLHHLATLAHQLNLSVLAEAHSVEELTRLLDSPADLIGINARNLHTFQTNLNLTATLISKIPSHRRPIAESAIQSPSDISVLKSAGALGFLIGETLMRSENPAAKLRQLLQQP